nr:MAG TPA: hypothetical protein [Caudoviricetes sp.]
MLVTVSAVRWAFRFFGFLQERKNEMLFIYLLTIYIIPYTTIKRKLFTIKN